MLERQSFTIDWNRNATDEEVRQLIQGINRTPEQLQTLQRTWDLQRGFSNHRTPCDRSMYTKRLIQEAISLKPYEHWPMQTVIDLVVTFCKRHGLPRAVLSMARIRDQIQDAYVYILQRTKYPERYILDAGLDISQGTTGVTNDKPPNELVVPITGDMTPSVSCIGSVKFDSPIPYDPAIITPISCSPLETAGGRKRSFNNSCTETGQNHFLVKRRWVRESRHRSEVVALLESHKGWVHRKTIIRETLSRASDLTASAVINQLHRLCEQGAVEMKGSHSGFYRLSRERKRRTLTPCSSKPFPKSNTGHERKTLSRTELVKRGWPQEMIDACLPQENRHFLTRKIVLDSGLRITSTFYYVSAIKEAEQAPDFEEQRARMQREKNARPKITDLVRQALASAPEHSWTIKQIARHVGTTPKKVAQVTGRLVAQGLISTAITAYGRRSYRIEPAAVPTADPDPSLNRAPDLNSMSPELPAHHQAQLAMLITTETNDPVKVLGKCA